MDIRYVSQNDDLFEISDIYEQSWKYAYNGIIPQDYLASIPKGRWCNTVKREGFNSLVAVENDKLIGTLGFCSSRWENYSTYGEIVSIYLIPEYIGKGIGQKLFDAGILELKKQGYTDILLWVLEDNIRARRFYEKNGFTPNNEKLVDNIGGKDLTEIMYIRHI